MQDKKGKKIIYIIILITLILGMIISSTVSNAGVMDNIINAGDSSNANEANNKGTIGVIYTDGTTGYGINGAIPYFMRFGNKLDSITGLCLDPTKGYPGVDNATYTVRKIENDDSYNNSVKILQAQYIVGYNLKEGHTIKNGDWTVIKQFACWELFYYLPHKLKNDRYGKNEELTFYRQWKQSNLEEYNEWKRKLNLTNDNDDINNFKAIVKGLLDEAAQYAKEITKINNSKYEPKIEKVKNEAGAFESYDKNTYKIGPFVLNYDKSIKSKTISDINVTQSGNNIEFASNRYLYSNGKTGNNLPEPGQKFYLIVQNFNSIGEKVKVTLEYKYYSYENIKLYIGKYYGMDILGVQPVLIAEGSPKGGTGTSSVEVETIKPGKYIINLNKLDSLTGGKLQGAVFDMYINDRSVTMKPNNDGLYNPVSIDINKEGTDTIQIQEVSSPDNYKKLNGKLILKITKAIDKTSWSYKATDVKITQKFADENNKEIDAVVMSYDNNSSTIKLDIKNEREKIKLSGYVWEDIPVGKETAIDGKQNNDDKFISGIQVTLHTSDGKNILYANSSTLQTSTNTKGYYEFEVPKGYSYYVEFTYNGQNYQHTKYTPWTTTSSNNGKTSNATETEKSRDDLNAKLETIYPNMTVDGTEINNSINEKDVKGEYKKGPTYIGEACYRISAYTGAYGNEKDIKYYSTTSENINLGLTKREIADLAVRKDVYKATLSINGYSQDYEYNRRNGLETDVNGNSYWDISARQSDVYYGTNYEREVKSADYNYNEGNRLSAEVVYKITIRNQSGLLNTKLTELVDYYDDDYTYKEAYIQNGNNKTNLIPSVTSKYTHNTTIAKYQKMYFDMSDITLKPSEDLEVYVVFTVKVDSSGKVIVDDGDGDLGKGNLVEIMGYKTYYGENAKSPNDGNSSTYTEYKPGDVAGRVDVDSNPGNVNSIDETTFEDDTDRAPYVKFTVTNNNPRTVQGVVWEDARTIVEENAVVGNGTRQDKEPLVENVTVELWDADKDDIAQVWNGTQWVDAKTKSDNNGYAITNFVPGNYYLIFKYKYGQNYKSTTYNYDKVEENFNIENPDILGNYKETTNTNYSDARDLWGDTNTPGTRMFVNNQNVSERTAKSGKLIITSQPEDQYIRFGRKATFEIEATGGENLKYEWHTIEGNTDKVVRRK